jgi:hypothetical protein
MKLTLLAAVASAAIISSGVVSHAQETPKHDQRPAAEHAEPKTAPRGGEAMKNEAPKAAEMQHKETPKGAEMERKEAPKAAETDRKEMPKAAEGGREEKPKAAEMQRKEAPKAAEMQRKDEANAPRRDEARDEKGMKPGDRQHEAQRGDRPAHVTGKVRMSDEHARRVGETLRRDGRPERARIDIRVGERIPQTVIVRPLPEEVVTIVPEYRGYDYFIDSNDEVVFVSPQTHEIVGTLDYEGRASADETRVSGVRPCPIND